MAMTEARQGGARSRGIFPLDFPEILAMPSEALDCPAMETDVRFEYS